MLLPFASSAFFKPQKIEKKVWDSLGHQKNLRVIVVLKDQVNRSENFSDYYNKHFGNFSNARSKKSLSYGFSSFRGFSANFTKAEIENLSRDANVKAIYYDSPVRALLKDSVLLINATATHNLQISGINLTGAGQTVCIIDTGVNYSHSDLGGCYGNNNASSSCKVLGGWDYVNSDSNPYDDEGHGTHLAGIVAANGSINGVAPEAKIISIKVLDSNGEGWSSDIINGIDWCVNNASVFNISVISMSLGSDQYSSYCDSEDTLMSAAINSAVAKNISVVVATGNTGSGYNDASAGVAYPACMRNATRISAMDKSDAYASYAFRNSNFPDILFAPGSNINSTYLTGLYDVQSGTSMATPHVAGAIAIMNQYLKLMGKTKTSDEIKSILNNSGKIIYDSLSGRNYSRINLYGAITSLDVFPPTFSNNSSDGEYRRYTNFTVNVSLSDDLELDRAWVESNHSGNSVNYSYDLSGKNYNFSKSFNITTSLKSFSYRINFNDSAGNSNATLWKMISVVNSPPTNYTISSLNWTVGSNYTMNLSRYFFDVDGDELNFSNTSAANVSIIINQTTKFATLIPDETFNGTSYIQFIANDSINSTYSDNVTLNIFYPVFNATNFDGVTTNFTNLSRYTRISVVLQKQSYGIINFSSVDIVSQVLDMDTNVNISFNKIYVNSSALSEFNTSAVLTLYNLTFSNPRILRDGNVCNVSTTPFCSVVNYSSGTLVFNVSGFSTYVSEESPTCSDGIQNQGEAGVDCGGPCSACAVSNSPGGGGGGSSGGSVITPKNVSKEYNVRDEQISYGFGVALVVNDSVNFIFGNEKHLLKILSLENNISKILISSQQQTIFLFVGENKTVDLNGDNVFDVDIKLNAVKNEKAEIFMKKVSLNVSSSGENKSIVSENAIKSVGNLFGNIREFYFNWFILSLVILVIAVVFVVFRFRKNKRGSY